VRCAQADAAAAAGALLLDDDELEDEDSEDVEEPADAPGLSDDAPDFSDALDFSGDDPFDLPAARLSVR
jgi:hypothetical protein